MYMEREREIDVCVCIYIYIYIYIYKCKPLFNEHVSFKVWSSEYDKIRYNKYVIEHCIEQTRPPTWPRGPRDNACLLRVSIHVYIYIYIYIYTHKSVCISIYIYIYMYMLLCIYVHAYVYVCVYVYDTRAHEVKGVCCLLKEALQRRHCKGGGAKEALHRRHCKGGTVSFHNFKSRNFKLSVSNPKKQICCLFVRTVSNFKLPESRPQKQT